MFSQNEGCLNNTIHKDNFFVPIGNKKGERLRSAQLLQLSFYSMD